MTDIRAKVAYLQGLAEGLDIEVSSPEGRILSSIIEVLGDVADQVVDIEDAQAELAEYVEDVDYDLGELEESVYEDVEDEDGTIRFIPDDDLITSEDDVSIVSCPQCGETLGAFTGDTPDMETTCPGCGCVIRVESTADDNDLTM